MEPIILIVAILSLLLSIALLVCLLRKKDGNGGLKESVAEENAKLARQLREEIASAFNASLELGFTSGMLVTNPIPEEYSMDPAVINGAIDEAIRQANENGIHGKETTPFLLAKVKELTGGDSLDSNIQLVFNNARLAAQTAVCMSK